MNPLFFQGFNEAMSVLPNNFFKADANKTAVFNGSVAGQAPSVKQLVS